ncbi:AI-2E family transporter [Methanolobus sp. ZRKC3]|uniref:AI-2E family transporter n=1 Tax=Methanolobus sp. ZRKC3 TaxID=3125786 RepID=UPI003252CC38
MKNPGKMAQALLILGILTAVLAYALYPYLTAFLGAFILYAVFRPLYKRLTERLKIRPGIASFICILASIVIILIPLYMLMTIVILEIQNAITNVGDILVYTEALSTYISQLNIDSMPISINIREKVLEVVSLAANFFSVLLINAVQSLGQRAIELTIMYFLLYYLFVGEGSNFSRSLKKAFPFNEKNTDLLLKEFSSIVNTTLISAGLIALIQGTLLTITFLILGIEGAFLWGFLTAILSFLPVVGATLVWIPAMIIQLAQSDYVSAVGVFIGGMILSSIDNFIRPAIQKKVGQIHPLVSLIGVIIGLNLFGLLGIVIGPLLLSYVIIMARMFNEEYLSGNY